MPGGVAEVPISAGLMCSSFAGRRSGRALHLRDPATFALPWNVGSRRAGSTRPTTRLSFSGLSREPMVPQTARARSDTPLPRLPARCWDFGVAEPSNCLTARAEWVLGNAPRGCLWASEAPARWRATDVGWVSAATGFADGCRVQSARNPTIRDVPLMLGYGRLSLADAEASVRALTQPTLAPPPSRTSAVPGAPAGAAGRDGSKATTSAPPRRHRDRHANPPPTHAAR